MRKEVWDSQSTKRLNNNSGMLEYIEPQMLRGFMHLSIS